MRMKLNENKSRYSKNIQYNLPKESVGSYFNPVLRPPTNPKTEQYSSPSNTLTSVFDSQESTNTKGSSPDIEFSSNCGAANLVYVDTPVSLDIAYAASLPGDFYSCTASVDMAYVPVLISQDIVNAARIAETFSTHDSDRKNYSHPEAFSDIPSSEEMICNLPAFMYMSSLTEAEQNQTISDMSSFRRSREISETKTPTPSGTAGNAPKIKLKFHLQSRSNKRKSYTTIDEKMANLHSNPILFHSATA